MKTLVGMIFFLITIVQVEAQFAGRFVGSGLDLTLKKSGNAYVGTVLTDGQTLKVSAQPSGQNKIKGNYKVLGIPIPFTARMNGNVMFFNSVGVDYTLERRAGDEAEQQAASEKTSKVSSLKSSFKSAFKKAKDTTAKVASSVQARSKSNKEAQPSTGPVKKMAGVTTNASLQKFVLRKGELGDKNFGVKFKPPAGWEARKGDEGYLLVSKTKKGFIVITPHNYQSMAQLKKEAGIGLQEEGGTSLHLAGQLSTVGTNGLAGKYTGTLQGTSASSFVVALLSPNGGGISIMAATDSENYSDDYKKYALELASSTVFTKREALPVNRVWKQKLTDVRLTYMWSYYSGGVSGSYAGGSQETKIDLCGQGYFRYSDNNQMGVDGGGSSGYSGGQNRGNGSWDVVNKGQQPLLVLKFNNGRVFEYKLTMKDNKIHLNGKKHFKTTSRSLAEYRPQCFD